MPAQPNATHTIAARKARNQGLRERQNLCQVVVEGLRWNGHGFPEAGPMADLLLTFNEESTESTLRGAPLAPSIHNHQTSN